MSRKRMLQMRAIELSQLASRVAQWGPRVGRVSCVATQTRVLPHALRVQERQTMVVGAPILNAGGENGRPIAPFTSS